MRSIVAFIFTISFGTTTHAAPADYCKNWFQGLGLTVGSADCELRCSLAENDMGSFDCSSRCSEFCGPSARSCTANSFWKKRLDSNPGPFRKVSSAERQVIDSILARLPDALEPSNLKAIVVSRSAGHPISISTPAASSDEFLILFRRAFVRLDQLDRVLVHEIVHFLEKNEWSDKFSKYREMSGWSSLPKNKSFRNGNFVEPDGKDSAEEDFANNVAYFIFDPKQLQSSCPEIFKWIKDGFGENLKFKECKNAK